MRKLHKNQGNVVIGLLVWALVIWGVVSLFGLNSDSNGDYSDTYGSASAYYAGSAAVYEDDGYTWAENNNVSSFEECQNQFGTSYEEDECNRYVKDNYSGYASFGRYDCTEDCSGHEAGYTWAEDNDISDEYDCNGYSNSFNEGCMEYVEENY